MKYLSILMLIPSVVLADGQCFVCKPQVKIDDKVQVVTKQMNLIPLEIPEINVEQELALQRQWEIVTSTIPISGKLDHTNVFRRHRFRQNIADYNPSPIQQKQIQTRSVTKTYTGYLKQSFSVNSDGLVNFNLSGSQEERDAETAY